MKMYEMYIKEREGVQMYYDDDCFFTYLVQAPNLQVKDLFVHPAVRREGLGKEMGALIETIAIKNDCHTIYCTSCIEALNWNDSHSFILANGYTETGRGGTMVYYKKEL